MATSVSINWILDGETEQVMYCWFVPKYLVEIICLCSGKSRLIEVKPQQLVMGGYTCQSECLACGKQLTVKLRFMS